MKLAITSHQRVDELFEDFGVIDKYGHGRGYRATIFQDVLEEAQPGFEGGYWTDREFPKGAGTYYNIELQNMRFPVGKNWETYQASSAVRGKFATIEGAQDYARKVMAKAKSRLVNA